MKKQEETKLEIQRRGCHIPMKKSVKMWGVFRTDDSFTELCGIAGDQRPFVYVTEELAQKIAHKLTKNSTTDGVFIVRPVTVSWEE
jgi:hypothetical protein